MNQLMIVDLMFLIALLMVGYKIIKTWAKMFPKGFDYWLMEKGWISPKKNTRDRE